MQGAEENPSLSLVVRRRVRGTPEQVFQAWTDPVQLKRWWGPAGVECVEADIDLRVGGRYRIANRLPDGSVLWIGGVFERVEHPRLLAFTWQKDPDAPGAWPESERVIVRFSDMGDRTEVIIEHNRILDRATLSSHEIGWKGCLDGLEDYVAPA